MPLANLFKRIRKDVKQAEQTSKEEKVDAPKNTVIETEGASSSKQVVETVKEATTNDGNLKSSEENGQIQKITQVLEENMGCENITTENSAKSTANNGVETAETDGVEVSEIMNNVRNYEVDQVKNIIGISEISSPGKSLQDDKNLSVDEFDPLKVKYDTKCDATDQVKLDEIVKSSSNAEYAVIDKVKLDDTESVEFPANTKLEEPNEVNLDEIQQTKLISGTDVTVQAPIDEMLQTEIISHEEMVNKVNIKETKTVETISVTNNSDTDQRKGDETKQIEKSRDIECSITYQMKKCELEPAGLLMNNENLVKMYNETQEAVGETTSKDHFINVNNGSSASSTTESEQAETNCEISSNSVTSAATETTVPESEITEKSVEANIESELDGVESSDLGSAIFASETENTNMESNEAHQMNTSQTDETQKNVTTEHDDSSSNESINLKDLSCATGQCPGVMETQPTCQLQLSKDEITKSDPTSKFHESNDAEKPDAAEHTPSNAKLTNEVDEIVKIGEILDRTNDAITTQQPSSNNTVNEVSNSSASICNEKKTESPVPDVIESEPHTEEEEEKEVSPVKEANTEIISGNDNSSIISQREMLVPNTECRNQMTASSAGHAILEEPQTKIDQISDETEALRGKPIAPTTAESETDVSIIKKECTQKNDLQFNDDGSIKEMNENKTEESLHSENSSNDVSDLNVSNQEETSLIKNRNSTTGLEETTERQYREEHSLCQDEQLCDESRDDKPNEETMVTESSEPPDIEEASSDSDELFWKEARAVMDDLMERVEKSYNEETLKQGKEEVEPIIPFEEPILSTVDSSASLVDSEYIEDENSEQNLPVRQDTQNWKVGYLQVKLPAKSRKAKLKAWQKRWVVIQADEFTSDSRNRSLVLSIYHSESGNSRSHSAAFWKCVCAKSAVVYRSMSRTHPYAFTIAEEDKPIVNLSSESESTTQEWMAAIRSILWPPSPVMQLEKVLNGNEFEVSIIDTDFSYRAGLLGTYGYMSVTNKKLILSNPQLGHVIQEWYLNTVDKFQILSQPKEEDYNKVLVMHTSRDSSTGQGEIKIFCNEAIDFLKAVASTIHKVLQYHSRTRGGECYRKELDELADWLTPQPSPNISRTVITEDYYKVPPRQVRSLLDIPNFIFDLPTKMVLVSDALSNSRSAGNSPAAKLKPSTTTASAFSNDSGISMTAPSDDSLNIISRPTSFSIGNRTIRKRDRMSSTSESSDGGSPTASPEVQKRPIESPKEAAET